MASDERLREYLKRVTVDLHDTRRRLREIEQQNREPVAIIGMACRYPGGVRSPQQLWEMVECGDDAISHFPVDRGWDLERLYHPDPEHPRTSYTREGGFIYDVGEFDAGFFGISPREALAMDPQQRLLLETSWEALEDADIDPHSLRGSKTGVFAGMLSQDYSALMLRALPRDLEGYIGIGTAPSVASGRIAYSFGFEGPAATVDTACSSSLMTLHLACGSLRSRECTLVLAGGVTVVSTPAVFVEFARQRGLAPDGRCKSFAEDADGTGWGEGAGVLLLELLSDAQRHGHRVLGVVRGSAVNQDGASNGLTAPNGPSQQRVIRQALADAGLSERQVDVVEAHGTGTTLGDPIEAQALIATYGASREPGHPLRLGSIKSNIGHTQAAAGVAGVIKMVMAMRNRVLPKTLHVDTPSSKIDWSANSVSLLREASPWERNGEPRRAGVSSFGMSGTNAHVIIEEAPVLDEERTAEPVSGPLDGSPAGATDAEAHDTGVVGGYVMPWVASARSAAALRSQAARLRAFVSDDKGLDARDVGSALAGRAQLEHRAVVVGATREELIAGLGTLADGGTGGNAVGGVAGRPGAVFLFPGQGSQWVGMARELLDCSSVFGERMRECEQALAPIVDWKLENVVRVLDGAPGLDRNDVVQPVLFSVMVSLAALWQACGVRPSVVVGHSQGEIAAACVAGGLSLQDAAQVVALRSRMQTVLVGRGAVISIAAPQARVKELLERWDGRIVVAAVNGPSLLVLAGENEALSELVSVCDAEGIRTRKIKGGWGASHSPQVEPLREELLQVLSSIEPHTGDIPFCSTVTGGLLDTEQLGAEYWYRNMREPVQFEPAVRGLLERGHRTFIEVSAHPVLAAAVQETMEGIGELADETAGVIGSLRRDQGGPPRILTSLGEAWVRGVEVDWPAVFGQAPARRVSLPTYAFQRERYWFETPAGTGGAELPVDGAVGAEAEFWEAVESGDPRGVAAALGVEQDADIELLPTLSAWRRRRRAESLIDSWRYRIAWKLIGDGSPALSGHWLIVVPAGLLEDEWVLELTGALRANGAEIVSVEIDEAASVDCHLLAARLNDALAGRTADGVLSLLSLNEQPHPDHLGLTVGIAATLTLVKALEAAGVAGRIWLATREAVSVGAGDALNSPLQGMIWGLGCTLGLEQPHRWGGLVDLPEMVEERSLTRLCRVLAGIQDEDQLAVRSAGIFARRLLRAPSGDSQAEKEWAPKGTVLITGGTGAVAAHVARWLAQAGAPHLLLVSRRGSQAPGAAELKAELEAIGARVSVVECDVSERTQLQELLASIPEEYPLDAVFHAAGTGTVCTLDALTPEQLEATLAPKANAALHLHELTEHLELSAFVLFSSMGATTGAGAQGDRVAADALLDALATHRQARGLPATSVAWARWAGEGIAMPAADASARRGVLAMDPELAVGALKQALDREETCLTVANIDWELYASTYASARARPLIEDLPEVRGALEKITADDETDARASALATQLAPLDASKRERVALELVRSHAATVMGYTTGDLVETRKAFRELGLDSLMALDLRNKLQAATGLRLPPTLVFNYPTPAALATFLVAEATADGEGVKASTSIAVSADEPIAIVGMSCRYPGGVCSPQKLWELVSAGRDAIGEFPTDRGWDLQRLYHPDPDHRGTSYVCEGGFLHDAGDFDAGFFGMSPREALAMDPQQRILLELCWEAFEDADLDPGMLRGSQTGVYVGYAGQDYSAVMLHSSSGELEGYRATGNMASMASGRVAYILGLEGPAMSVDTACSSSLVALHLACQALRQGECALALAGGVTIMSSPVAFIEVSRQRGFAPDGRCKAFADSADGTSFSEGVGVLVLERLSEAQRLDHEVVAVVRGSAVNQDGASNGLTAPHGPSQERVIRQALANSRLSPDEVDAVEAHGTGTMLGDPIEAQALLATYGKDRPAQRPLWLGSIKSNIGHTSAAAGVAGVIKMAMALRHGALPRTLYVDEPSRQVDWSAGAVSLLTEQRPWESNGRPRRAGVSSFGASGTNAHVILEEAPPVEQSPMPEENATAADGAVSVDSAAGVDGVAADRALPECGLLDDAGSWVLSGKDNRALRGQAERLLTHVGESPGLEAIDVGFSLARRPTFETRAVVVGKSRERLLDGLGAVARDESAAGVVRGVASRDRGPVSFLFPGQGSQWAGMASELLDRSPVFGERIDECEQALLPFVDWSLTDVLRGVDGAPGLERIDVVQPALFAVMVSLAGLWAACGVVPDVVVGHSQGEIAAACVAGGLTLHDAMRVVALRSRMLTALEGHGAMTSIVASRTRVNELLEQWDGRIVVAAVNGPRSMVLAGETEALSKFVDVCDAEGIRTRRIKGGQRASHSSQVEGLREELLEALTGLAPVSGDVSFHSTVTGGALDTAELGPGYWYRNMREPVQFEPVVRGLLEGGYRTFIEISAHPVLAVAVQETIDELAGEIDGLAETQTCVIGSLRRDQGGATRFLTSLGEAWVQGVEVDWQAVFGDAKPTRVSLPRYAFQRERFWPAVRLDAGDVTCAGLGSADHPLLGASVELADERGVVFTGRVSLDSHPWLADHAVMDSVLLPAAGFVELVLHAGARVGTEFVSELTLQAPLVLDEDDAVQLQVVVGEPDGSGQRSVGVYSRPEPASGEELCVEPEWRCHASGVLVPAAGRMPDGAALDERAASLSGVWPPEGADRLDVDDAYERLTEWGYDYGPAFQGLRAAWRRGGELFAEVSLPEDQRSQADLFGWHPALLDAAFHVAVVSSHDGVGEPDSSVGGVRLPASFGGVGLLTAGAGSLRVRISRREDREDRALSLVAVDETGELVGWIDSLVSHEISAQQLDGTRGEYHDCLFDLGWVSVSVDPVPGSADRWVSLGGEGGALARSFGEAGMHVEARADLECLVRTLDEGAPVPEVVLFDALDGILGAGNRAGSDDGVLEGEAPGASGEPRPFGEELVGCAHAVAGRTLLLLQRWLADERLVGSRLVVVTHDALSVRAGEDVRGLAAAPVWGLVRSAQSENPGRFVLVDLDRQSSLSVLCAALTSGESQLAVREQAILAPRLERASRTVSTVDEDGSGGGDAFCTEGTVLVTGGTGRLGGALARHLVAERGARQLLLVSRQGPEAPGATELQAELCRLGAQVRIAACDVSDRAQLKALLDTIPREHPLTAIVHAAGVLDDGVMHSSTVEQLDRVLAPKLDAAWHLHELTEEMDLQAFVLSSSAVGLLGDPGPGSHAAGNVFLDTLAAHRHARGLPAISLAWGSWAIDARSAHQGEADKTHTIRSGAAGLSSADGLGLFDIACATDRALVVPMQLDMLALRAHARAGVLSPLLRGFVRMRQPQAPQAPGGLARRMASAPEDERKAIALELVLSEVAAVLGHQSSQTIDPKRAFLELGFDSLTAVELRNRLSIATGLPLPTALAFDHPTPAATAAFIANQLDVTAGGTEDRRGIAEGQIANVSSTEGPPTGMLTSLFREAHELGRLGEFTELLMTVSRFRPTFDAASAGSDCTPERVRLCEGTTQPSLVCFPSAIAMSGPHEYARFAQAFRGSRDVSVSPAPGYASGQRLPASFDVMVETQAEAVLRHADGAPFALVGYSSGGILAHAVASHIEESAGVSLAAVVLIDTHALDIDAFFKFTDVVLGREGVYPFINDVRLTAMAAYLGLLAAWKPTEIATPLLLARATEPIPGLTVQRDWRSSLEFVHTAVDIPGHHFTIMDEHADATARAVEDWLSTTFTSGG